MYSDTKPGKTSLEKVSPRRPISVVQKIELVNTKQSNTSPRHDYNSQRCLNTVSEAQDKFYPENFPIPLRVSLHHVNCEAP
jgi:hypothetical protein